MNRAYQYRIYPDSKQAEQIQRTFGCCRFVYNQILSLQNEAYESNKPFISRVKANNYCNQILKQQFPFLKEVDKFSLTNSIWNLDIAFQNYFAKQANYPKFKTKRSSRKAYTTNYTNNNIAVLDHAIKLPKLKAVKAKIHRPVPQGWVIKSATISQTPSGEYYCAINLETSQRPSSTKTLDFNKSIGLDYKSNGLYIDSCGFTKGSPKYYQKAQKRLARESRKLSRKKPGSKNYLKQKQKVAKIHRHIANQRKDYLHKESLDLAKRWDIVCVETLNMRNISNHGFHIGKQTMDNGYGMFLDFLQYKLEERDKLLIKVDKYFPSSQLCSLCGEQNKYVKKLSVSEWECPNCHAIHARDINAAENIRRQGLVQFHSSFDDLKTA